MVCLLVAGIITPLAMFGLGGSAVQSQTQLSVLLSAAESSRSYAHAAVDYAVSHGLSVGAAQAQLVQGDTLLATARADAQSGADLAAGFQAVRAAMSDYSGAAIAASLALGKAGLIGSADFYVAEDAVAEVNATASIVLSVEAQACESAQAGTPNAAFTQACATVRAQVAAARAHLSQAAAILVQISGHAGASVDYTQVLSFVASARTDLEACQSSLLTIASYTYSQRGHAYIQSVVIPLYGKANATIKAEQSLLANMTQFGSAFASYSQSQANAVAGVTSSASTLGGAIAQVDTSAAAASVSAAQDTAAQVTTDMTALQSDLAVLPSTPLLATLVADINACSSATASYTSAIGAAGAQSAAYSGTRVSSFSSYLAVMKSDAAAVQTSGATYVTSYQSVEAALANLINAAGIPPTVLLQLQQLKTSLTTLESQVKSTTDAANASLQQETSAMTTVQADISSLTSVVSSAAPNILVRASLVSTANSISSSGAATYLNSSASAALAQLDSAVRATADSAQSFVTSANACLQATVGTYGSSDSALSSSSTYLSTQTQNSAAKITTATAYVNSDSAIRTSEAASGRADVNQALQLFSNLDVSGGVAVVVRASLEFQAAAGTSA
jgi:hypothetical protein